LFAALSAYLLFKRQLQGLVSGVRASYGVYGLVGFGVLLVTPFVSIMLMASVLGSLVGVALLVSCILLLLVSWIVTGVVLGTLVLEPLTKSRNASIVSVAVGVVILVLLPFIPYIGPLLMIAALLVVLGGISTELYRKIK